MVRRMPKRERLLWTPHIVEIIVAGVSIEMSFFVVFLGVPLTIYLVFVISPFLQALYYSLTDWGGFSMKFKIVGLENYRILFADPLFRRAMLNNVILCVFVPLVAIASALALATMLTVGGSSHGQIRGLRGSGFYRVVSFFPYCVPAVVIGLLWSQLLCLLYTSPSPRD